MDGRCETDAAANTSHRQQRHDVADGIVGVGNGNGAGPHWPRGPRPLGRALAKHHHRLAALEGGSNTVADGVVLALAVIPHKPAACPHLEHKVAEHTAGHLVSKILLGNDAHARDGGVYEEGVEVRKVVAHPEGGLLWVWQLPADVVPEAHELEHDGRVPGRVGVEDVVDKEDGEDDNVAEVRANHGHL